MTSLVPLEDRFWAKVQKTDTCWLWIAGKERGYGRFRVGERMVLAHRYAYELLAGRIPDGMFIDHRCHVPACVNPGHLRVVTRKQNLEHQRGARADNLSSGIRGVTWHKQHQKWYVTAGHNGRLVYGGLFTDIDEAERAAIALRNRLFTHNDHDRRAS